METDLQTRLRYARVLIALAFVVLSTLDVAQNIIMMLAGA
ncbi:MAG: hypothetical protein JWL86_5176 [Rhizobium sp.]|nr:hypothetical protein [Rhizobium sp.]